MDAIMPDVVLRLNKEKEGAFYILEESGIMGEMKMSISGNDLTVYHTEVRPEAEGKGYAKKLLEKMTGYARENNLKVTPLCPYVHAQFKRHPEMYADLWNK